MFDQAGRCREQPISTRRFYVLLVSKQEVVPAENAWII